jgi:hypothetical protein
VAWLGYKCEEPKLSAEILEAIDKDRPARNLLSFKQEQLLEKVYAKVHYLSRKPNKHRNNLRDETGNYMMTDMPGMPAGSTV